MQVAKFPYRTTLVFSVACLVGMVGLVTVLGYVYQRTALDLLVRQQYHANEHMAAHLKRMYREDFTELLAFSRANPPEALPRSAPVRRFARSLGELVDHAHVVRLKLYDTAGLTVFSTARGQIGSSEAGNEYFQAALRGEQVSAVVPAEELPTFGSPLAGHYVVNSYLPFHGGNGDVLGVLEVYVDLSKGVAQIEDSRTDVTLLTAAVCAVLYAALVLIVVRTDKRETDSLRAFIQREKARATMDDLTGLPNRLAFGEYVPKQFDVATCGGMRLVIGMVDIDHFKQVNDIHGHAAGDRVLRYVAKRMRETLRDTDFIARFGGEEFICVLPDSGAADAVRVLERVRRAVHSGIVGLGEAGVRVSVSVGVAERRPGETPEDVIARADGMLYRAKRAGRNRVCSDDRSSACDPATLGGRAG